MAMIPSIAAVQNQAGVNISVNSLEHYVRDLQRAITTPNEDYERIGVKVDGEEADWSMDRPTLVVAVTGQRAEVETEVAINPATNETAIYAAPDTSADQTWEGALPGFTILGRNADDWLYVSFDYPRIKYGWLQTRNVGLLQYLETAPRLDPAFAPGTGRVSGMRGCYYVRACAGRAVLPLGFPPARE